MNHFDKFIEYARNEIGEVDGDNIFNGPDFVDDVDHNLYAYGRYVIDRAKDLDPVLDVDASNEIDYAEHKNHFLVFHSDYFIGSRAYRVILEECEFMYGKMAEDTQDFHNQTDSLIRSLIRNYHHVLNHIEPNLNSRLYNLADFMEARPDHE